ncbi:glucocorticoid modulatory element-binding protein 1-like [Coregonus clupeaformis]|uniref:glucocorticoid modulatory element-binding protein 1-like n=1 Tax=Coregonus clupeaformis TaxID=59861 RepID=UPI001BE048B5|nr:glucocorticoid modulatory element-binding protein 1-like [Coregonus clupeaformis]
MAGAEITVSSKNIVMVKEEEEEGEPCESHKTQVILHQQPIIQGANEDNANTGSTVLAIETHNEDNLVEGEEVEYGYPITCGESKAVLLFKKFVCPGINIRCVKFNDQLISPKQFVHMAGKATLKDWKRAIRLGGVMLRKMMDSGQIDFYQHETVCTNTCRSTKFDVLINSTRFLPGSAMQPPPSLLPSEPISQSAKVDGGHAAVSDERLEEKDYITVEWSPGPAPPITSTANGHVKRKRGDIIPDGSLSFWRGIADVGLMGEVLSSFRTELVAMLRGVEVRSEKAILQEADAVVLNSLSEMFGLLDSVRRVLDLRRSKTDDNQQQVHNALNVLEDQLEDQRKPRQDEPPPSPGHLYMGSFSKAIPSKCPRLHRSSSSTTQPQNQTTQSSIVLSPITTSPVGQPLNVACLPVGTLAQFPTGSQLFTYFTTGNTSAGKRGRAGSVAIHAASRVTVRNNTTESGVGTPLQVLHLTQEREQESGDMESQRLGLGEERIVLVQHGLLVDTPGIQTH